MTKSYAPARSARKKRIRNRLSGTSDRPRLTVTRTLTQLTAQLVDDVAGKTLLAASTKHAKASPNKDGAAKLGKLLAEKAKAAGISTIVFDRNGYKYHGRVQ